MPETLRQAFASMTPLEFSGRIIKINDVPVTIIGVNPKGFTGAGSTLPSRTPETCAQRQHQDERV